MSRAKNFNVAHDAALALELLGKVRDGFQFDPGTSDLDDEQPIHPCISLGDMRKIRNLLHRASKRMEAA